jgi:hypothetical protein
MRLSVSIQTEDFDVSHELAQLRLNDTRVGAVCSFVGWRYFYVADYPLTPNYGSLHLDTTDANQLTVIIL